MVRIENSYNVGGHLSFFVIVSMPAFFCLYQSNENKKKKNSARSKYSTFSNNLLMDVYMVFKFGVQIFIFLLFC